MKKANKCPFCGQEPMISQLDGRYRVFCIECGIHTDGFLFEENAIEFWNCRKFEVSE